MWWQADVQLQRRGMFTDALKAGLKLGHAIRISFFDIRLIFTDRRLPALGEKHMKKIRAVAVAIAAAGGGGWPHPLRRP